MKKLIVLAMAMVIPAVSGAWTVTNDPLKIKTDKGVIITISQKSLEQYRRYWNLDPNNIDWDKIDVFAEKLARAYGAPNPYNFKVSMSLFDEKWVDNETPTNAGGTVGREMTGNHWDGTYWGGTITIHLGDDPATGPMAWCQTALDYELGHHYLKAIGDICWYYEFSGNCPDHYISAGQAGLCQ